jgi:glycosyltransferase involved in cell wall biosynthesis
MEEDAEFDARFLNKKIFLHIGSLGFIHNCTFIIDAAIELKKMCVNDDIVIVFIGEGSQRQLLEQKAKIMSLNNVFFLGLKPKSKLPFWMKKSVASLFTTLNNSIQDTSSPNKIFDSFAAGRPIIQNTKGWIYNLVEDQGIGINAPTPPAMAKAIFKLAQDEDIAKVMGTKSLNYAKTNLDSEILSKRYLDYLN